MPDLISFLKKLDLQATELSLSAQEIKEIQSKAFLWKFCHRIFLEDKGYLLPLLEKQVNFSQIVDECIKLQRFDVLLFVCYHLQTENLGDIDTHFYNSIHSQFNRGALFFITQTKRSLLVLTCKHRLMDLALYAIENNHLVAFNTLLSLGLPMHQKVTFGSLSLMQKAYNLRKYQFISLMIESGAYFYRSASMRTDLNSSLLAISRPVQENIYNLIEATELKKDMLVKSLKQANSLKDIKEIIGDGKYSLAFVINTLLYHFNSNLHYTEGLFDYIAYRKPDDFKLILGRDIVASFHKFKNKRLMKHCLSKSDRKLPDEVWSHVLTFSEGAYNMSPNYLKAQNALKKLDKKGHKKGSMI